jgi:hypothetical protein
MVDLDGAEFSTFPVGSVENPIHFNTSGQLAIGEAYAAAMTASIVPEPSSFALLAIAVVVLLPYFFRGWRQVLALRTHVQAA